MTATEKLEMVESSNESILCVGLDPQLNKIPEYLQHNLNGLYNFNCSIIDATADLVSSYKLNFAFYEQYGNQGIEILQKTLKYIPNHIFTIADAKRGDIGNSSKAYANAIFNQMNFDSVTLSPYMGYDSLKPFFDFNDKMFFVLALTSNPSSADFQRLIVDDEPLFLKVIRKFNQNNEDNMGFVVGATHPDDIGLVREVAKYNYLLIPGIGSQGGDLQQVLLKNNRRNCIINVSRDVIYASNNEDFSEKAREKAQYYKDIINNINLDILMGKIQ